MLDHFNDKAWLNLTSQTPASNWCVLIDPTLGDPKENLLSGIEHEIECQRLFLPFQEEYCPYLLGTADSRDAERLLSATIELARMELLGTKNSLPRTLCAWLKRDVMEVSLASIAIRLGQAASIKTPNRRKTTVFRYYDPRLSNRLVPIIGLDGWRTLTQETWNAWWIADAQEGAIPLVSEECLSPETRKSPLTLNEREFDALLHLGWSNRIEAAASQWDIPGFVDRHTVEKIVRTAMCYGLTTDKDFLAYGYCALMWHPEFDKHPEIQAIFSSLAEKGNEAPDFSFLVEQIDDARWQEIVQWLNKPQQATPLDRHEH